MSARTGSAALGPRRSRREVIDVPEARREDKSLDKLLYVRKQRLNRLERERNEARTAWQETRASLRKMKMRWRRGVQEAKDYWQDARADFFKMSTTSGQFRKAKAVYERMKNEAAELYLQCREAVEDCKLARTDFFEARKRVMQANRQQEKLTILRDEIRMLSMQSEM